MPCTSINIEREPNLEWKLVSRELGNKMIFLKRQYTPNGHMQERFWSENESKFSEILVRN